MKIEEIRNRSKGIAGNMPDANKAEIHRRDCVALLSIIDQYKKESELTRSYLVTIGNIARRQDNTRLQEINRHVDDILESLEKE